MEPATALRLMKKTRSIEGWLSVEAGLLFAWLNDFQRSAGVTGNIFEIGVHHGKSSILLGNFLLPDKEWLGACDIFEQQSHNVSHSGSGCRSLFDANIQRWLACPEQVKVYTSPSEQLEPESIGPNHRLFHIDGGHDKEEALHDLRLAASTTIEEGLIVIDDCFRHEWPEVTEAIIAFLQEAPEIVPVVAAFNKLVLARRDTATKLASLLLDLESRIERGLGFPWHVKTVRFHQSPMVVFHQPPATMAPTPRNLMLKLRQKPAFRALRKSFRR